MAKRRVVVTGMGLVSCFGNDLDSFYQALLAGKSGVRPITRFPCEDYTTRFAGWVEPFDSSEYIDKKQARRIDPFILYAVVAGKRALRAAGLVDSSFDKLDKTRSGILIGSGMGGMTTFNEGATALASRGYKRLSPFFVPHHHHEYGRRTPCNRTGLYGSKLLNINGLRYFQLQHRSSCEPHPSRGCRSHDHRGIGGSSLPDRSCRLHGEQSAL